MPPCTDFAVFTHESSAGSEPRHSTLTALCITNLASVCLSLGGVFTSKYKDVFRGEWVVCYSTCAIGSANIDFRWDFPPPTLLFLLLLLLLEYSPPLGRRHSISRNPAMNYIKKSCSRSRRPRFLLSGFKSTNSPGSSAAESLQG